MTKPFEFGTGIWAFGQFVDRYAADGYGPARTPRDMLETAAKAALPKSELRSSKLIDGVVWDGKNPAQYADGFKIKA